MKIFAFKDGKTIGPFSKDQILADIKMGRLKSDDQICTDGKNWILIKDSGILNFQTGSLLFWKIGVISLFFVFIIGAICLPLLLYFGGYFSNEEVHENITDSQDHNFSDIRDLDYFEWESHPDDSFKNGAALVISSSGKVRYQLQGNAESDYVEIGQVLTQGTRLITEDNGEAVILFTNGTSMSVGNNTNFLITSFGQKEFQSDEGLISSLNNELSPSRIKLNLDLGELVVVVKKLNKQSSFLVQSELGFAGVRGTSFAINSKSGLTSVNVISGEVDFLNSDNQSKLVGENHMIQSDGNKLSYKRDVPRSEISRIILMEKEAKNATKDISVSKIKNYFDRLNLSFGSCDPIERERRFLISGGTDEIKSAIHKGLDWLAMMQTSDGSWGANDRDDKGNLKPSNSIAMSGMAVICFLQNCELDLAKKRGLALENGVEYLSKVSISKVKSQRDSYAHPIFARAVVMAYQRMKREDIHDLAKKTISMIIDGQNENGGWAYAYGKGPVAHVDLSVTGWNLMALLEAHSIELQVDRLPEAIDRAMEYVKKCQDKNGMFAYKLGSRGKASLTGMGAYLLQFSSNDYQESVLGAMNWIEDNLYSEWENIDSYEFRHTSKACLKSKSYLGNDRYWESFKKSYSDLILENQKNDGSWPTAKHFHGDSDIFRTALMIDALLTFYEN